MEQAQEEKEVETTMKQNGYLPGFILADQGYRQMIDPRHTTSVTLPYISGLLEAIRQILRPFEISGGVPSLDHPSPTAGMSQDPVPIEEWKGIDSGPFHAQIVRRSTQDRWTDA